MNKKVQKESSANDVEIEQLIYDSKDKCCGCSACANSLNTPPEELFFLISSSSEYAA